MYKCNIEVCLGNHCCRGKAVSIIYSDCVSVALVIQHAKHMYCIILSSVACLAPWYFYWTKNVFWFSLQHVPKTFLTLRRIQGDIIINVNTFSCKIPVILVRFEWNLNLLNRFLKNIIISNFTKLLQVRLKCSMWTDGQTDRHEKANSHFSQFCNAPKNKTFIFVYIKKC
jgi:hypothetical protein